MSHISRRDFLKAASTTVGATTLGALLAACGVKQSNLPAKPPVVSVTGGVIPPTAETQPGQDQPTSESPALSNHMAVVRNGEPEALVRKALDVFGGMGAFVKPGANVIIKPNICVAYRSYDQAATTNPWVVGALVKLCFEAGASRVRVMDNPFDGTAQQAYKYSGIQQEVEANGGEMEIMSSLKYTKIDIPGGLDFKSTTMYDEILNADVLINVPIAKDHELARLTLGMKNLLGVVQNRPGFHSNLGQRLADLASLIRPAITVVDAVRILTFGGPTGGDSAAVQKLDTLIVSPDIVATDAYAATLFGLQGSDLDYVVAGAAMGLGNSDLTRMKIEEINLAA
jgi:uncharacterized protein (DUF362 family)